MATPKGYYIHDADIDYSVTADEVIEDDDEDLFTGLLDASGDPIYRESEKIKLGFDISVKPKRRRRKSGA